MTQQTQRTFARTNLLRICYGETGVGLMDFVKTFHGEGANMLQTYCYGVVVYVADLSRTC